MLAAGRLTERVTIQREIRTPVGGGSVSKSWKEVITVWGEVIPLRGGEALVASVQRTSQLWKVTIRARDGLDPSMRLVWKGITMNIRTLTPDPAAPRDALVMTAESGVAS